MLYTRRPIRGATSKRQRYEPRPPYFEIRRATRSGRAGWRYRIKGANGGKMGSGEFYTRLATVRATCARINPRLAVKIIR